MKCHLVNRSSLWVLEKSYLQRHRLKKKSSFLHLINQKTLLSLKPMLKMKTMISKGKIFVRFILVLQMKYILRR